MTSVEITETPVSVTVVAALYRWSWTRQDDRFTITDDHDRTIAAAPAQPGVLVHAEGHELGQWRPGRLSDVEVQGSQIRMTYREVNGTGTVITRWSMHDDFIVLHPPRYSDPAGVPVMAVSWFPLSDESAAPGLMADFIVQPGSTESPAIGPVLPTRMTRLDMTSWLGRGSNDDNTPSAQQWGLPMYYFGGYSLTGKPAARSAFTTQVSDSFCCGLTAVPTGDLLLTYHGGHVSPVLRLYGDRWKVATPSGEPADLGTSFLFAFGTDYREAIRSYYSALVRTGAVTPAAPSDRLRERLAMSQFNTWGAQMAEGHEIAKFHQEALESIYDDVRAARMQPGMFGIDDKWEGQYGLLEHDTERFPRFEEFLDRVRGDGHLIGLWAAFLRCDQPEALGLTTDDMLSGPTGEPVVRTNIDGDQYYLFDVSIPLVRDVLRERARQFVRRYRPALVKFDFGYELPSMRYAAPREESWGGEQLLPRALELVIGAMREVDPDVVVMYYMLSPLLLDWVDQHSMDDLWVNVGEYDLEVNRRLFFSSLLTELGVPSYGSGGYDWLKIRDIWFDTVAAGPIGSLGAFHGDQQDSFPTPLDFARYRGLSRLVRRRLPARVVPLTARLHPGSDTARSSSWARLENDMPTVVALRATYTGGEITPAHYASLVETDADVVVASLTDAGIPDSDHLGIVHCGSGTLRLTRTVPGGAAHVTIHTAAGSDETHDAVTDEDGTVTISLRQYDGETPIDWVECVFSTVSAEAHR